jgi:CMP-N,N'-diacetyllegionaminic acid synthase
MPNVLGVITARGGSKRVPGKNVKMMLGAPLISYICRAALGANLIDRLILTTDDDDIMAVARNCGVEVPFRRPPDLSEDVPSEDVVLHALDWAERDQEITYDLVVTLQPTTPFVQTSSINQCIRQVVDSDAACCITVHAADQPPEWQFALDQNGEAQPFVKPIQGEDGVFQSLPVRYMPNGAAYATRVSTLREQRQIITHPLRLEIMDAPRSVDIDTPFDWIVAETVGRKFEFGVDNS